MKNHLLVMMLSLVMLTCSVFAQTGEVLKEQDLKRSDLIQALTLPDDHGTADDRNINIRPKASHKLAATAEKAGEASILITFETNSADLTARAKQALDVVADALNSEQLEDFRFEIGGHADPRGSHEWNMQLSSLRAQAVRDYLVFNKKVVESRLVAKGKGDTELMNKINPISPENRRVTIVNLSR